jgi:putative ABC transport system permease protein
MTGWGEDLRLALRGLLRRPGFAVVALLVLSLSIGANAGLFTVGQVINGRPVDLPDMDRLVMVAAPRALVGTEVPPALATNWADRARSFAGLGTFEEIKVRFSDQTESDPDEVTGYRVTGSFFSVLGARVALGRGLNREDVEGAKSRVAVISQGLWMRRFGGGREVIGRTIKLHGVNFQIVGVMAPETTFPLNADIWTPLFPEASFLTDFKSYTFRVFGRLKSGVPMAAAESELRAIQDRLMPPRAGAGLRLQLIPFAWGVMGSRGALLRSSLFASYLVLIVGALNLAVLLMARSVERRKEIATCFALGASRLRVVRRVLTETLFLASAGAALSLLVAYWTMSLSTSLMGDVSSLPGAQHLHVGAATLLYALSVGLVIGLLFGIVPAIQLSHTDLNEVLKQDGRGRTSSKAVRRIRDGLLVVQAAIAFVLLFGGISFLFTLQRLTEQRGFDGRDVTITRVDTSLSAGNKVAPALELTNILERSRGIPGFLSAAAASREPYAQMVRRFPVSFQGEASTNQRSIETFQHAVTPDFFKTLRIPLIQGRLFGPQDSRGAPAVALVSQSFAERYLGGENPVGKVIRFLPASAPLPKSQWYTIVGVVGNIDSVPASDQRPQSYIAAAQTDLRFFTVFVRTTEGAASGAPEQLRRVIRNVAPGQPISYLRSYEDAIAERIGPWRLIASVILAFGVLSLLLACVGLSGSASFLVAERRHEVGIRMAVGAGRDRILRFIMGKAGRVIAIGLLLGLGIAVPMALLLADQGLRDEVRDPAMFARSAGLFLMVALASILVPSVRAARTDPTVALRYE